MEANKDVELIAKRIVKDANADDPECGSVLLVLTIIGVVLSLIRVIQECNKKEASGLFSAQEKTGLYHSEIKNLSVRRGFFTRARIKKALRRELSQADYEKHGLNLTDAIINNGQKITTEETEVLMRAANV
jgi:hypothetical protein